MGGEIVAYLFYVAFAIDVVVISAYWVLVGRKTKEGEE